MSIDIRLPPQLSGSDRDRTNQMYSYLYQLATQLQWALKNVDTSNTVIVTPLPKSREPSAEGEINATATFSAIKDLIIKSADIVTAYTEKINETLSGEYVARTDFGTFQQNTEASMSANSTNISTAFTNIQTIRSDISNEVMQLDKDIQEIQTGLGYDVNTLTEEVTKVNNELKEAKAAIDADIQKNKDDIENISFSLLEVNANIRSGLLYNDDVGIPVYGLEIGQKNVVNGVEVFNKYARFTSGRLSFYDKNDNEVAFISDYKLYITHAEVTGSLKLGGYLVDTTNGLTFKWVGKE